MNAADFAGITRPDISFDRVAAVVCADLDQFTVHVAIATSLGVTENTPRRETERRV